MRKLFLALLALTLLLPSGSIAETPLLIDVIGLEVAVPDDWTVDKAQDGTLDIRHESTNGRILFNDQGNPVEESDTSELSATIGQFLAGASAIALGADDPSPLTGFDYSADGRRIVGGAVTYELDGKQRVMWAYMFTSVSNTWATCSFTIPTDESIDVSWMTGTLETAFPELSEVDASISGNTD